eukprot:2323171-Rhodomonas_salina.6
MSVPDIAYIHLCEHLTLHRTIARALYQYHTSHRTLAEITCGLIDQGQSLVSSYPISVPDMA